MTANHRALDDSDIALIERVKLTPSLYDPRNPDFRVALKKELGWNNVASCLGLAPNDARRRWTCLRDRYSRELKQLRLHPNKGEFGKNNFFLSMDFLRGFVRKRRERRRTSGYKFDNSWDSSNMDDTRLVAKMIQSEDEEEAVIDEDGDDDQGAFETTTTKQTDFQGKIEVQTTETDDYSEYVDDTSETYEDYSEHHQIGETLNVNVAKSVNNGTIIPVMFHQTSGTATTFALSAQQNVVNATTTGGQQHQSSPQPQLQLRQQNHSQQHEQSATIEIPTASQPKQIQYNTNESTSATTETEDDFFCKSIAAYLRQLSRRHKIKAKVEMFQILEKYIELEESAEIEANNTRK